MCLSLQVFLEPEGRDTPELYVQGFSTGLPERLQLALLRTLPGVLLAAVCTPQASVRAQASVVCCSGRAPVISHVPLKPQAEAKSWSPFPI